MPRQNNAFAITKLNILRQHGSRQISKIELDTILSLKGNPVLRQDLEFAILATFSALFITSLSFKSE